MSDLSHIKAILADDVTGSVLRADGIDPRDFLRTLEAAAARIRARRDVREAPIDMASACWKSLTSAAMPRCGA
jgi:hypothetical protein